MRNYDKLHATTVVATAPIERHRFVSYNGAHTPAAPDAPVKDCQGIAEESATTGEAVCVITSYSALLEMAEAVAAGDYIQPASDGSGRGAKGSRTDHCGRALSAATKAGQIIECQLLPHLHA